LIAAGNMLIRRYRYIKTDLTGRDASEWKVAGILYNDIFYDTFDEFRTAITTEGFVRNGANEDGSWAHTDQEGPIMKGDELYPPIPIAPQGSRFSIDPMKQYVEWMDFSFYIAFSRDTGVRLFNIKYKRDRIIYEIGLQEAMAIYGKHCDYI